MVIDSVLPHMEFGSNDHREDASHFDYKILNSDFQGALLLALWYPARDMSATYNELLMGISISCFFLSLVMMCLYYSYFHPNKLSHAESEGK